MSQCLQSIHCLCLYNITGYIVMERVDAAEKEASEVLHSLLSVERVEKHGHELDPHHQQQVCTFRKTTFK